MAAAAVLPSAAGHLSASIGADSLTQFDTFTTRLRRELSPAGVQGPGYFLDCSAVSQ